MFKIEKKHAKLTNLNIGKEGSGDGERVRIDLRMRFIARSDVLTQFIDFPDGFDSLLWSNNAVVPGLEGIKIGKEVTECEVIFGDIKLQDCTIKNVSAVLMNSNMTEITLTIQEREPEDKKIALLSEMIKEGADLTILGPAGLFDEEAPQESAE